MRWLGYRAARDIWWFFVFTIFAHTAAVAYNIVRTSQNEALVTHTLLVLNSTNRLLAISIDSESGSRGFVVTGDEKLLEPFETSKTEIPQEIARLYELTSDNEKQTKNLKAIEPLIERRMQLLNGLVAEGRQATPNRERISELVRDGKLVMDQIKTRIHGMMEVERDLFSTREESAKRAFLFSIFTTVFGGIVAIGLMILARWTMYREYETRRSGEAALRLSNERFGTLAETVPQIVWVARNNGQFEFFNQQWYDYTGTENTGSQLELFSAIAPECATKISEQWKCAVASRKPFEVECPLRRRDGKYRWHLIRALPMKMGADTQTQWFGTCTDIEDQRQAREQLEERVRERTDELNRVVDGLNSEIQMREELTEQLQRTAAELTRSNRELEQFAYVASHDLQEPLRKIQTFSDRLKTRFGDAVEGQMKDYVDRMQGAAGRMRQLINDLLSYSRVSTSPHVLGEVDLNEIVKGVLDDLEEAIVGTEAQIEVHNLPTIVADPSQMRQLFQNIISNALKFRKNDTTPHIEIKADEVMPQNGDEKQSRIFISDNGIGFDQEYADRIFQVFRRLHGRNEYEGTGIGLAVVRKIVDRHNGRVIAHGRPGEGSTFEIILPVSSEELADKSAGANGVALSTMP